MKTKFKSLNNLWVMLKDYPGDRAKLSKFFCDMNLILKDLNNLKSDETYRKMVTLL